MTYSFNYFFDDSKGIHRYLEKLKSTYINVPTLTIIV